MSEQRRGYETMNASALANLLATKMEEGAPLDPQILAELVGVLKASQQGDYKKQPPTSVAASGYVVEARPLPLPEPKRTGPPRDPVPPSPAAVMRAQEAVRVAEGFPDRAPWNTYHNQVSMNEVQFLSESERQWIEAMTRHFVAEVLSFHVARTKAIGSTDYCDFAGVSIKDTNPPFDWRGWSTYLQRQLSPAESFYLRTPSLETNTLIAVTTPELTKRGAFLLKAHLLTPRATIAGDGRPVASEYVALLKRGQVFEGLLHGAGAALYPFVLKNAALALNPEYAAYFDGSVAGAERLFGRAPNPLAIAFFGERTKMGYLCSDTSKRHLYPRPLATSNEQEFFRELQPALGRLDQQNAPDQVDLLGRRGTAMRMPRVTREDGSRIAWLKQLGYI